MGGNFAVGGVKLQNIVLDGMGTNGIDVTAEGVFQPLSKASRADATSVLKRLLVYVELLNS
ncbi:hypothetical protein GCM10010912_50670 [Paenibacillus albidus]|uniref:Uncharacterized protein n=1 Tax=Paenibacillus albidus TaxID=2041023 RepID=A0A917CY92_9BACL|nr:hypothetical protein GCM10010912_50670 [Paenibacillus albidus]